MRNSDHMTIGNTHPTLFTLTVLVVENFGVTIGSGLPNTFCTADSIFLIFSLSIFSVFVTGGLGIILVFAKARAKDTLLYISFCNLLISFVCCWSSSVFSEFNFANFNFFLKSTFQTFDSFFTSLGLELSNDTHIMGQFDRYYWKICVRKFDLMTHFAFNMSHCIYYVTITL